eukprot:XP_016655747.1 PREDICTED: uncharacterized protein LOC107882213 [Acyrthosiphon pisum]
MHLAQSHVQFAFGYWFDAWTTAEARITSASDISWSPSHCTFLQQFSDARTSCWKSFGLPVNYLITLMFNLHTSKSLFYFVFRSYGLRSLSFLDIVKKRPTRCNDLSAVKLLKQRKAHIK